MVMPYKIAGQMGPVVVMPVMMEIPMGEMIRGQSDEYKIDMWSPINTPIIIDGIATPARDSIPIGIAKPVWIAVVIVMPDDDL